MNDMPQTTLLCSLCRPYCGRKHATYVIRVIPLVRAHYPGRQPVGRRRGASQLSESEALAQAPLRLRPCSEATSLSWFLAAGTVTVTGTVTGIKIEIPSLWVN